MTIDHDMIRLRELTADGFVVLLFTMVLPSGEEIIIASKAGTVSGDKGE